MRVISLASVLLLVSCGGTSSASSGETTSGGATPTTAGGAVAVHAGSGCTGHDANREAMCLAEGCQWGPALVCSGIEREPDPNEAPRPCACVCEHDLLECASVP